MRDILSAVAVIVVIFVVVAMVIVPVSQLAMKAQCSDFASVNSDMEFKYTFWNGCLVKLPNGMWLSATHLRWANGKLQVEQLP